MAYIKFCVVTVETVLKDQSVYVTFNKEVDIDSLNYQNIILALNGSTASPLASYDITLSDDLKTLKLHFIDAPIVNQPYILVLQDKISDLEGKTLDKSLFRNVLFKSSVTSDIILNSPANFEVISTQTFSWQETGNDPVNSFRLQIGTDTSFFNTVLDSVIKDQTSVTLSVPLKAGQYYYRVRAEVDSDFGVWSEIRTFLIQESNEYEEEALSEESIVDKENEVTVEDFVGDIKSNIITVEDKPLNGTTPSSFSFLFSEDIDPNDIKISVIRSDF